MTTFPGSPRLLKGGIVQTDPETGAVGRGIAPQRCDFATNCRR
jgi:hypothetical protein